MCNVFLNSLLCFHSNIWKWFVYFHNSIVYNMLVLQTLKLIYLANDKLKSMIPGKSYTSWRVKCVKSRKNLDTKIHISIQRIIL